MAGSRTKVLFFAEAVTLAHVARPLALARALDPARYEITIACDERYAKFAAGPWSYEPLKSIPGQQFTDALAKGAPVYDAGTLERYAEDDLVLIRRLQPDLVVGDFRLSLSASARVVHVPYIAIANAYWSPHYASDFPLPVLPMTKMLPLAVAGRLFSTFRPMAFAMHARPMNKLRAKHGLPSLGSDLRRVYTDADHHLIPDIESLYPVAASDGRHSYIGALSWSPPVAEPVWWNEPVPADHAVVYATLGSSGSQRVLQQVLDALADLPVRVIASAAGASSALKVPANARLADYLPGDAAAARSRLVICNGGSLSTQQALAAGVPVLGIASNMDQFFNMRPLEQEGAAATLRVDRLSAGVIRDTCRRLLSDTAVLAAARRLQPLVRPARPQAEVFDAAAARVMRAA